MPIRSINAITLATHDMPHAIRFYRALGFSLRYGDEGSSFTSFEAGASYLNLVAAPAEQHWSWWGRVIFHVDDVHAFYAQASWRGLSPTLRLMAPRGASGIFISPIRTVMN